jgi:hydroxyethylthiazole kinase-like uncharacterized protein yjeF
MGALEEELFASGLPVEALMEKAGLALARRLLQVPAVGGGAAAAPPGGPGVLVLAGPGHNGGDGLVVARELHLAGIPVQLWSPFERRRPLTERHWRHARWLGIPVLEQPPAAADGALWIDALFGNGQSRPPGEAIEALLAERAQQGGALVAIDVPTGLCGDSGMPLGRTAARADLTLCIGLWKRGLVQDRALAYVGELERIDLGFPPQLLASLPETVPLGVGFVPGPAGDAGRAPRPALPAAAGKYGRGRLLVVAGSDRYRGAAHLALAGATAAGCGSLRAALPAAMEVLLWQTHPHVVLEPASASGPSLERLDGVLVGPGIGAAGAAAQEPGATPLPPSWWEALCRLPALVVVDADGLGAITSTWLQQRQGPTWITPHQAEFERLFPDLASLPPLEAASEAARHTGAGVLLKGARSVVASADGRRWQLLRAAAEAARAGLGDVLAGYAAGLGCRAWAASAACEGQLLALAALDHAEAGLRCGRRLGPGGATPMAIAQQLARAGAEGGWASRKMTNNPAWC